MIRRKNSSLTTGLSPSPAPEASPHDRKSSKPAASIRFSKSAPRFAATDAALCSAGHQPPNGESDQKQYGKATGTLTSMPAANKVLCQVPVLRQVPCTAGINCSGSVTTHRCLRCHAPRTQPTPNERICLRVAARHCCRLISRSFRRQDPDSHTFSRRQNRYSRIR